MEILRQRYIIIISEAFLIAQSVFIWNTHLHKIVLLSIKGKSLSKIHAYVCVTVVDITRLSCWAISYLYVLYSLSLVLSSLLSVVYYSIVIFSIYMLYTVE